MTNRTPSGSELARVDALGQDAMEVLLVDEERSLLQSCAAILEGEGFSVTTCARGDDGLRMIRSRPFDIVIIDQNLGHVPGSELLTALMERDPEAIAIVMTENPTVESSVSILRAGAWDYLPKPFSAGHFAVLVGRAAHALNARKQVEPSAPDLASHDLGEPGFPLYGRSDALRSVIELARKVAPTDASVFITGESGTGKEVIAQFIHRQSRRAERDIVPVNCAAIPEALLESEMFGHVEGAFTGAVRSKAGLLEVADGSTLFLDELTDLPSPTQAKLLRVLQDGIVRRVGSTKTDAVVDIRVIAATNRDPIEAIEASDLRRDLHYRLCVVPIYIPPLRERREDIEILAQAFLTEFWTHHRGVHLPPPSLSSSCVRALEQAPWPGNVRELRNVIEHAVVLAEPGQLLDAKDISFPDRRLADSEPDLVDLGVDVEDENYHSMRERVLARFEVEYLSRVVAKANGNISVAARAAGVDRTTLYRLMDKHGIQRPPSASSS